MKINLFSKSSLSSTNIKIKVLVGVPFRDSGDRLQGFNLLKKHFKEDFPNFDFIEFNNDGDQFNLSKSRNLAIKYGLDNNYDIVVLNDADLFLNKDALIHSIYFAHKKKEIVIPFSLVIHLNKKGTELFCQKKPESMNYFDRVSSSDDNSLDSEYRPCGGVIIGPPQKFADVGMYDENYVGWGHEDVDFHFSYEKKYGKKFNRIDSTGIALFSSGSKRGTHNNEYYFNKNKDVFDKLSR